MPFGDHLTPTSPIPPSNPVTVSIVDGPPGLCHTAQVTEPTDQSERLHSLDILRGVAVLGILVMNIQSFAMPEAAYMNPSVFRNLEGANYAVWFLSHVFFDQKMMTIFSMLFGAGVVLFTQRREERGEKAAGAHYRRTLWLLVFGLIHAYVMWNGDVLFFYGLCALWIFLLRKVRPSRLLTTGIVLVTISLLIMLAFGFSMPYWPEETREEMLSDSWLPPAEEIAAEIEIFGNGSYFEQFKHRAPNVFMFHTVVFLIWGIWRVGGNMLIGMALFKYGVLTGTRSRRYYQKLIAVGAFIGVPLILYGVYQNQSHDWSGEFAFFLGSQYNTAGSMLVALGWIGVVMLFAQSHGSSNLALRFAAVGRMAFSNYIGQTIICTALFYGWGGGLFGEVSRVGQFAVVLGVWAIQLVISPLWLRRFCYGPMEWLWRSLTYTKRQPFRL